jgi:hypothetical protein
VIDRISALRRAFGFEAPERTSEPATHDYTRRYWGHNYDRITETHWLGWGHGIQKGDIIIIGTAEAPEPFEVVKVKYFNDPKDMWTVDVTAVPHA